MNNISTLFLGVSIALASGIMLYVAFGQMLPESNELNTSYSNTLWLIIGVIFGFIMINII